MTMHGWQEDQSTDVVRTRDLARREADIMRGIGKPWAPTLPVQQAHIPPRVDWYRVAALTIVILAACAGAAALIVGLALFLTAF